MVNNATFNYLTAKLSDSEFDALSGFIQENFGIKMPPAKKTMLEARLQKRLRRLEIYSFKEYCELLFSREGQRNELFHMIDVITTNKTEFFREPQHFEYLVDEAIPELLSDCHGRYRMLRVWSAGCSTGEEPYTIAIVLEEYKELHKGVDYSILASDISERVLDVARTAVYPIDKTSMFPFYLKRKYLLKSKDESKASVRIKPGLRKKIDFENINLIGESLRVGECMDVIFCRNVLIYFDRHTQELLLTRLYDRLCRGGYLFLGHSETLCGMNLDFVSVAPTVYRKV